MPKSIVIDRGLWSLHSFIIGVVALFASAFATTASACPDWSLTGQQLSYSSDQLWTPSTHTVVAGGQNNLTTCPQPGRGWVATQPDFELNFSANSAHRDLEFRIDAGCDSVLLINDAAGQWHFDDDSSDGLNSRLRLSNAAAGTYDVWVGTYGSSTCSASITFETFAGTGGVQPPAPTPGPQLGVPVPPVITPLPPQFVACPNPNMNGQMLSHNAWNLRAAQRFNVTAGGNVNLRTCPSVPGGGHVARAPDFTMDFTSNRINYALEFRTEGACDPVLLIHGPDGQWQFNDDDAGLNSRIRYDTPVLGEYDIWVGTFGTNTCDAALAVQTVELNVAPAPPPTPLPTPPPPQPVVCPDPGQNGQILAYNAQSLWSAQRFNVTAGGNVDLGECPSVPGHGHIIQRPDFTLNLGANARNYDLEFRIEGTCDPVLLVNDSTGHWHYNDDDNGTDSRLRLSNARPGMYDIWVGTYDANSCQAVLVLETFNNAPPPPPPPPQDPVLPDPGNLTSFRNQIGQSLSFRVIGTSSGRIWGTDVYTDDSALARAAVHAGLVQAGQTGVVHVTVLPGQSSYQGSVRNGVQSSNYGSWMGSYQFVGQQAPPTPAVAGTWRADVNGWGARLDLAWNGSGWVGALIFDATGSAEALADIRFDPTSGSLQFTRPVPAATQAFQGVVRANQITGQYSLMGGPFSFAWSASR